MTIKYEDIANIQSFGRGARTPKELMIRMIRNSDYGAISDIRRRAMTIPKEDLISAELHLLEKYTPKELVNKFFYINFNYRSCSLDEAVVLRTWPVFKNLNEFINQKISNNYTKYTGFFIQRDFENAEELDKFKESVLRFVELNELTVKDLKTLKGPVMTLFKLQVLK